MLPNVSSLQLSTSVHENRREKWNEENRKDADLPTRIQKNPLLAFFVVHHDASAFLYSGPRLACGSECGFLHPFWENAVRRRRMRRSRTGKTGREREPEWERVSSLMTVTHEQTYHFHSEPPHRPTRTPCQRLRRSNEHAFHRPLPALSGFPGDLFSG
jgi:hypothetical protein